MPRKGLMKRLSKSATDISGCTKKSHSTSPTEETVAVNNNEAFSAQSSAQSTPALSDRRAGGGGGGGFLGLLRQRLAAGGGGGSLSALRLSSSRESRSDSVRRGETRNQHEGSAPPEIIRYRRTADNCTADVPDTGATVLANSGRTEVIRHHVTPMTTLPMALAQELELSMAKEGEEEPKMPQSNGSALSSEEAQLQRLRANPAFLVHVHLKQGFDLAARDSNGSSDPYVKFIFKGKVMHKSKIVYKDLNPMWDENCTISIDDPFQPLEIKVYDYDWAFRDDFMGETNVNLSRLDLDDANELLLHLTDSTCSSEYLGQISLELRLEPRCSSSSDRRSLSLMSGQSSSTEVTATTSKRPQSVPVARGGSGQLWAAVVNVVLIEGRDLLAMDFEGTSDPYCKFRLSNERYKSKPIMETLNPRWLEQFDLNLFSEQSHEMEITVWDKDQRTKDDFMGRCSVNLLHLRRDRTHDLWLDLEEGAGQLHLLVTVSGLANPEEEEEQQAGLEERIKNNFQWSKSLSNFNEIGHLVVKVFCARGLMAADLGGKSDPYAVLELDNERLQTHTQYKTVNPVWNRTFNFIVKDVNSALTITVNDEDSKHTFEFLGKLSIPLLQIESGRKRWFALKDKKQRCRAKGANPQILLELTLAWNPLRASVRTFNPKEERYMQAAEKFKRQIFLNNVMRLKAIIMEFVALGKFVESCLEWEHPVRSVIAFAAFLTITYFFQPYMLPIGLLLIFLKNYVIMSYLEQPSPSAGCRPDEDLDGLEEEDLDDKEEKKTLKARLQAIQEVTAMVQNALGYVASLGESVKNTFNFSVPFLSWLAVVVLVAIALVLYFISLRFLVLVWGINKFTKKLIRPNYVPNNELLDFLSRVPDDEALADGRELRPLAEEDHLSGGAAAAATPPTKKKKTKQS